MTFLDKLSPNFGPRPQDQIIDTLILHYTGMQTMAAALKRLHDPDSHVSCHYLIDEDGSVYRLVDEKNRAWHAGLSAWRSATNLNDRSIGIELVNPGHEFGYRAFADAQMQALLTLSRDIVARHPVPPARILGHSDIAPARKQDPGELFDWRHLAARGIGVWPDDQPAISALQTAQLLTHYGYDPDIDLKLSITAFQRHFYPDNVTGIENAEMRRRLLRLIAQIST